ncbi:MAG TPA: Hsp20/alpha crystallin family protein [Thermoplasmata archaeon]|nr:Hsp20/alpha crystallin family protein [Thermoplasmata archaeon]
MATESKKIRPVSEEPDLFHDLREQMRAMEEDLGVVRSRLRTMVDPWLESRGLAPHSRDLALAAVDVEDLGTTYEARFDLPGVPREKVSVKVVGQRIEVRADAGEEKSTVKRSYVLRERSHRGYERILELPQPIIGTEVGAKFDAGVLTLTIPKTRQAAEHRIPVA